MKMAHGKSHSDAAHALSALVNHDNRQHYVTHTITPNSTDTSSDMRQALIESDFTAHLRNKFIKGGAESSHLLHALGSLAHHGQFILAVSNSQATDCANDSIDDLRKHIIDSTISPLVESIRKGNIFSITFAYECIRPTLLKHGEIPSGTCCLF